MEPAVAKGTRCGTDFGVPGNPLASGFLGTNPQKVLSYVVGVLPTHRGIRPFCQGCHVPIVSAIVRTLVYVERGVAAAF